ncbi:MAG: hypothetical protein QOH93_3503 [Chloroflexia bacterium]|nr:hypothetical protein [Chloroflexia bacterium]
MGRKRTSTAGLTAGLASLFCVGVALFQLYLGLQVGGFPPETLLFGTLALIFAMLWWTSRRRAY